MPIHTLESTQRAFAEELRIAAPVRRNRRILNAFATVRRDLYLTQGPWLVHGTVPWRTPNAAPAWVHHNVLISLDKRKGINNGSPSFWAYLFDHLDIKQGERVLQVGAGSGYYTAILAELVGKRGYVTAVEYDKRLAQLARTNLSPLPNVELIHGDAANIDPGCDVDIIVAFTGGTHAPDLWLDRLAVDGRLLMPLVGDDQWGFMLRAIRRPRQFEAKALSHVGIYLAKSFRTKGEARDLKKAVDGLKGKLPKLRKLHRGSVPKTARKDVF